MASRQRSSINVVIIDLPKSDIKVTVEAVTDAKQKIVFDRFHVEKNITNAVDPIRRSESMDLASN
jgi:transposase